MHSKKILYIGNNLKAAGGLPTGIDSLSENLRREGFEISTASDKKNKVFRLFEMLLLVLRNSKSADYVLIDTYSTANFWYAYFGSILCQTLKLKYIPILHGGDLPNRINKSPNASKRIFRNAYINIAPSQYLMEKFIEAGYTKVEYIPNSIDLNDYPFKFRKEFSPVLLWVRAFDEIYNPILALRVLQALLKKIPETSLTMVGPDKDGSMVKCLDYAKRYQLPVKFKGRLQKEEWITLSRESDIFINTTSIDNTPVSIIEAMALGLPVISTNVGGLPYLLSHNEDALLVPQNDYEKMASAVEEIINKPENTSEMTLKARAKAETFDWGIVKQRWLDLLS